MTEFERADLDKNGTIEKDEWDKLSLEDRRLEIIDSVYVIAASGVVAAFMGFNAYSSNKSSNEKKQ